MSKSLYYFTINSLLLHYKLTTTTIQSTTPLLTNKRV